MWTNTSNPNRVNSLGYHKKVKTSVEECQITEICLGTWMLYDNSMSGPWLYLLQRDFDVPYDTLSDVHLA